MIFKNKFNINPTTALNGKIALDIVNENLQNELEKQFDIIILDINMPIMGGFEALKFIKESYDRFILK